MKKIFVANLPFDTSADNLRSWFEQFGHVEDVLIVTHRDTGRSRGFGFVNMSTKDEAESAIFALNGRDVKGRNIAVIEALSQKRRNLRKLKG